ncbi:tetratricopeptide repeat-containing sensor histidine kinase [Kordia sp.]|uniref:ATP-binding protein n=1 Tax=Kordia sp. TaxID=1965332 RepID=UPI003D6C4F25
MRQKITYIIFLLQLFNMYVVYGQYSVSVDSMQNILPMQKGIERIETLNELAWKLRERKDSIGIKYALEALQLSKQKIYYKGISDGYSRLGAIALEQKNNVDAEDYYLKVLAIDEEENFRYGIARASNQLGLIYTEKGNITKALEYFLSSLEIFREIEKYKQASKVAEHLGKLYSETENYESAFIYFENQLEYSKQANYAKGIVKSYKNLGNVYKALENYKEALNSYQEAEKLYLQKKKSKGNLASIMVDIATMYDYLDQDEASKRKFNTALQFIQKNKKGDLGTLHFNFGAFYRKLGQKDSTAYHYKKAEEFFKKKKDDQKLLVYFNNVGNKYYDDQDYEEALSYYNQSLALQKVAKDSSTLVKTYSSISRVFRELGNSDSALIYSDSATLIRKAEFEKIKNTNQYQITSANTKKALVNAQFQKEKAENIKIIAVNKAEQRKMQIIILFISLISISILFFFITKARKQKQQRILAEANLQQQRLIATHEKEQQVQQLQELIKTQEMNAINAMISGQEEERKRIAQDLHDNLGSKLSLVKIHYQSVEDNLESIDEDAKTQYEKANQLLDEACKSVREISHNMISGTLSKFGLIPALKELKQTLENVYSKQNQHGIHIELSYHKLDNRLENTMEIQIYRIIQELLNNIIKHAKATQVDIQILKLENGVNIIVEDDGIGFDVEKQHKGIGLKTIQSRVVNMKGSCLIDSGKGNGTTVTIDIPT